MEPQHIAWTIASVFTFLSVVLSAYLMYKHLTNYHVPPMQRLILRIILMVPIYSVDSLLSLIFRDTAIYWNTARNCYEAFVIYTFMSLLIQYLGGREALEQSLAFKEKQSHLAPFCCCPKFKPGPMFIRRCMQGTLQYCVVKVATTVTALVLSLAGLYADGQLRGDRGYLYITIIDNISVFTAMYCLILFYKVTRKELAPWRPVGKFICIKAVIFFSFWQAVTVAILTKFGVIVDVGDWTTDEVATALQDLLICIEMFLAALGHIYAFSHRDYMDPSRASTSLLHHLPEVVVVNDVMSDMKRDMVPRSIQRMQARRAQRKLLNTDHLPSDSPTDDDDRPVMQTKMKTIAATRTDDSVEGDTSTMAAAATTTTTTTAAASAAAASETSATTTAATMPIHEDTDSDDELDFTPRPLSARTLADRRKRDFRREPRREFEHVNETH